jgi:Fe-S cluster biogenesis protein NfuA
VSNTLDGASKRVEALLERFNAFPSTTGARADAEELVHVISGLYGEGLQRLTQLLRETLGDPQAESVLEACCSDPLVASLLIAHGLHPVSLQKRVQRALDELRPKLQAQGAAVEIVGVDEDVVEVRLDGSADLIPTIESAVYAAAPEVLEVRASGQTISLLEVR